jgi:hypothetical protein
MSTNIYHATRCHFPDRVNSLFTAISTSHLSKDYKVFLKLQLFTVRAEEEIVSYKANRVYSFIKNAESEMKFHARMLDPDFGL